MLVMRIMEAHSYHVQYYVQQEFRNDPAAFYEWPNTKEQ